MAYKGSGSASGKPRKVRPKPKTTVGAHDVGITSPKPNSTLGNQRVPSRTKPTYTRPTIKSQPGPSSDKERRKVKRFKKTKEYKRSRKVAQKARQQRELRETLKKARRGFALGQMQVDDKGPSIREIAIDAADTVVPGLKEGRDIINEAGKRTPEPIKKELKSGKIQDKVAKFLKKHSGTIATRGNVKAAGMDEPNAVTKLRNEAIDLTVHTPTAVAMTGKALVDASKGDSKEAEKQWKQYREHGFIPPLVEGKPGKAWRNFKKAPLASTLEVAGAKGAIGRGVGATTRTATGGKVGGLQGRPNRRMAPRGVKGPERERNYSKDIINKQIQKAADKGLEADNKVSRAVKNRLDKRAVKRDVNTQVGYVDEGIRREDREDAMEQTGKIITPKRGRKKDPVAVRKKDAPAVHLAGEGTIRRPDTAKADLEKRLERLKIERGRSSKNKEHGSKKEIKRRNEEIATLEKLLKDDLPANTFEATQALRDFNRPQQLEARREGLYDAREQSQRFDPYLQSHKDAEGRTYAPTRSGGRQKTDAELKAERKHETDKSKRRQEAREQGGKVEPVLNTEKRLRERVAQTRAELIRAHNATKKPAKDQDVDELKAEVDFARKQHKEARDAYKAVTSKRPLTPEERQLAARTMERRTRRNKDNPIDPLFISQREQSPSAPFYKAMPFGKPAPEGVYKKRREGGAYARGTRELGGNPIIAQHVGLAGEITRLKRFRKNMSEYGISPVNGQKYGRDHTEAKRVADDLSEQTGRDYVVVNIAPIRADRNILRVNREKTTPNRVDEDVQAALSTHVQKAFEDNGKEGRYVVVEKNVTDQALAFQQPRGRMGRAFGGPAQLWKDVTLTTQDPVSWLSSNIIDLQTRSLLSGVNPITDPVRAMRGYEALKRRDPEAARELSQSSLQGALYAESKRSERHNPIDPRSTRSKARKFGPGQLKDAWDMYRGKVHQIEGTAEKIPLYGAMGKQMGRDISRFKGLGKKLKGPDKDFHDALLHFMKLSKSQMDEYTSKGKWNKARERKIQKAGEHVVGRWGKVSPGMRQSLAFAPFLQWPAAALRFTGWEMPIHQPVKTGLISASNTATEEQRKKVGLSSELPWEKQAQKHLMGGIYQGMGKDNNGDPIPMVDAFQRRTSFGVFAGGLTDVPTYLLPQIKTQVSALLGFDWKGEIAVYPQGHPKAGKPIPPQSREAWAIKSAINSFVPGAGLAEKLQLGGRYPSQTSTAVDPKPEMEWDPKKKKMVPAKSEGWQAGAKLFLNPDPPYISKEKKLYNNQQILDFKEIPEKVKHAKESQAYNAETTRQYNAWKDKVARAEMRGEKPPKPSERVQRRLDGYEKSADTRRKNAAKEAGQLDFGPTPKKKKDKYLF